MLLILTSTLETQEEKNKITDIYNQHIRLFLKIANKMLGNRDIAEDIVYDTFLTIIENKDKIFQKTPIEIRRYSVLIVENKCRDILRKEKRTPKSVDIDEYEEVIADDFEKSVELKIETKEQCEKLSLCLDKLSETNFQIIKMKYYQQMSIAEIANELGMTVAGVNSRLERSRIKIRKLLTKEGVIL
jgi:RNA polymerase sigma-70 factor (ECF subfamily)